MTPAIGSLAETELIEQGKQNIMAGTFWLIGSVFYLYLILQPQLLRRFGVIFFTKLLFGYAINHFPVE